MFLYIRQDLIFASYSVSTAIRGFFVQKLVRFDWAIKYLLRSKANFDILEGFLKTELLDV